MEVNLYILYFSISSCYILVPPFVKLLHVVESNSDLKRQKELGGWVYTSYYYWINLKYFKFKLKEDYNLQYHVVFWEN